MAEGTEQVDRHIVNEKHQKECKDQKKKGTK